MKRMASVIRVKPEKLELYKIMHQNCWPQVKKTLSECGYSHYSVFLKDDLLFSYFEYTGTDYKADMKKMGEDPVTQLWWSICRPCCEPLPTRAEGEWGALMEEVFHLD